MKILVRLFNIYSELQYVIKLKGCLGGKDMLITREDIVNELHEKTGYYKKAIYVLLKAYGEVVLRLLDNVTEDEEVVIQLVEGIRVGVKVVPQRERVDPRTYDTILCEPTIKPFAKFSKNFRHKLNQKYKSEDQTEG